MMMDFIEEDSDSEFKLMIEKGSISPNFNGGLFLKEACKNGQESIVDYLLRSAKLLLPSVNQCFFVASEKGRTEVVRLLLTDERVNPTADNDYAIRLATQNGHTEVVRL